MMKVQFSVAAIGFVLSLLLALPPLAWGHCDTLEGPVVVDAREALAKGDVTPVLKWIPAKEEGEIREAFAKTLAVRGKGKDVQELADLYFFETLVRVHRASEGAPYTGLKSGGVEEETIVAADQALAAGSVDGLVKLVVGAVEKGIRHRFEETLESRKHAGHDVAHGRKYVANYVEFIHYGERIYQAAEHPPSHHAEGDAPAPAMHAH